MATRTSAENLAKEYRRVVLSIARGVSIREAKVEDILGDLGRTPDLLEADVEKARSRYKRFHAFSKRDFDAEVTAVKHKQSELARSIIEAERKLSGQELAVEELSTNCDDAPRMLTRLCHERENERDAFHQFMAAAGVLIGEPRSFASYGRCLIAHVRHGGEDENLIESAKPTGRDALTIMRDLEAVRAMQGELKELCVRDFEKEIEDARAIRKDLIRRLAEAKDKLSVSRAEVASLTTSYAEAQQEEQSLEKNHREFRSAYKEYMRSTARAGAEDPLDWREFRWSELSDMK